MQILCNQSTEFCSSALTVRRVYLDALATGVTLDVSNLEHQFTAGRKTRQLICQAIYTDNITLHDLDKQITIKTEEALNLHGYWFVI